MNRDLKDTKEPIMRIAEKTPQMSVWLGVFQAGTTRRAVWLEGCEQGEGVRNGIKTIGNGIKYLGW